MHIEMADKSERNVEEKRDRLIKYFKVRLLLCFIGIPNISEECFSHSLFYSSLKFKANQLKVYSTVMQLKLIHSNLLTMLYVISKNYVYMVE